MSLIIPFLGVFSILVLIFGFLAFLRYMSYKETLALAEKGLTKPATRSRKGLLRWGIIVTTIGFTLTVGLYVMGFNAPNIYPLNLGPWMLGGLIPLALGIGLILLHYLTESE